MRLFFGVFNNLLAFRMYPPYSSSWLHTYFCQSRFWIMLMPQFSWNCWRLSNWDSALITWNGFILCVHTCAYWYNEYFIITGLRSSLIFVLAITLCLSASLMLIYFLEEPLGTIIPFPSHFLVVHSVIHHEWISEITSSDCRNIIINHFGLHSFTRNNI